MQIQPVLSLVSQASFRWAWYWGKAHNNVSAGKLRAQVALWPWTLYMYGFVATSTSAAETPAWLPCLYRWIHAWGAGDLFASDGPLGARWFSTADICCLRESLIAHGGAHGDTPHGIAVKLMAMARGTGQRRRKGGEGEDWPRSSWRCRPCAPPTGCAP